MTDSQKAGGVAALACAATMVVGFALYISLLIPARYGSLSVAPLEHVAFLVKHQALLYAWNLVIYIAFGASLVVAGLALHQRLKVGAPNLANSATAFALIWAGLVIASGMVANIGAKVVIALHAKDPALAASTWLALSFVVNGLGGGNEVVGGLWMLLVSLAALQIRALPKALNYLGLVVSVAGLLTVVPALGELGSVFGLGSILWFNALGVVMLRDGMVKP